MHTQIIVKRILGLVASLLAAILWQLFCHFIAWTPADNMLTALQAGALVWSMLIAFSAVGEIFAFENELDLVLLFGSGAFFWLVCKLLGVPSEMGFWGFFFTGVAHFAIAYGGKKALFLKAPLKGSQQ